MVAQPSPEPLYMLRRKDHVSVSAVKEYLMCPRRYSLHYVERVLPSFRAAAAAFGSAWHETIGYWLTREGVAHDELETFFRDDLIARLGEGRIPILFDDDDQSEGRLIDTGLRMLRVFLARVRRPETVLGVEVPFSMDLSHPLTGEVLPMPLIGALDAVVVDDDGRKYILELKTAKRRWTPDQVEFDLQVSAYKLAAHHLGYDDATLRLLVTTKTVHPDVQVEDPARHEGDLVEVIDVIFGVHAAVRAGADYRSRGWQCRSCPFAEPCRP